MTENTDKDCFCCPPPSSPPKCSVDVALEELGMLSTVTDSRKEFIREQYAKCVTHRDKNYMCIKRFCHPVIRLPRVRQETPLPGFSDSVSRWVVKFQLPEYNYNVSTDNSSTSSVPVEDSSISAKRHLKGIVRGKVRFQHAPKNMKSMSLDAEEPRFSKRRVMSSPYLPPVRITRTRTVSSSEDSVRSKVEKLGVCEEETPTLSTRSRSVENLAESLGSGLSFSQPADLDAISGEIKKLSFT